MMTFNIQTNGVESVFPTLTANIRLHDPKFVSNDKPLLCLPNFTQYKKVRVNPCDVGGLRQPDG